MIVTQPNRTNFSRFGFTLVELLVVISIMAALTALMLPRLRVVNKDRGIREAARVVGSKFAEASDRARRDGKSSVTLIRNPNMLDIDGVQYASSTIYLSRAVPNFTGDDAASTGMMALPAVLQITKPLEYEAATPSENVVRVGDLVRMNEDSGSAPVTSTVAYRITGISEPTVPPDVLNLELLPIATQPSLPGVGTTVKFVIERQPKILRSSITDLPPGYIVDLRLSGPLVAMETANNSGLVDGNDVPMNFRPLFYEKRRDGVVADSFLGQTYGRVDVFFDSTGAIASVRTYRGDWDNFGSSGGVDDRPITGPLQLFVAPTELEAGSSPLYSDTNLWVTISNTSGGVNIGYNNPPLATVDSDGDGNIELFELVTDARRSANTGRSANQ